MKSIFAGLLLFLTACCSYESSDSANKLTTGTVQKEIRIGMPASDVALALGAPNIVSLDENKNEVWVYDKASTEVSYGRQGGGIWLIVAGAGCESGYAKRGQKTLTVIIKYDSDKLVKDINYHSSSF